MSQQPPPPPPPPPPASSSSSTSEKEPLKVTIVEDESKEMNEMKEEAERLTAKDKVEIAMYADKLYGDAKELMAQGRFKEASDVLSHVLEKKSLIFGEESVECLEPYIDYGKSLLTMAKQISVMKSVFASDPQKAILNENEKEKEKKKEEEEEEGDDDDADDDDDDNSAEKAKTEGATSVSTGDDDDDEHEDINELLETAWDCLELARVISTRSNPNTLKLSDVLMDIGDISLENGNTQLALDDYGKALKLRLELCKPDDRRIAEVYYSIGLTYSTIPENEEKSKENYVKSKEAMVKRIDTLSKEPSPKNDEEIKELRELISGVDARIEELSTNAQEGYLSMEKIKELLKENMGGFVSALANGCAPNAAGTGPVTNLGVVGHTEKRKAEDTEEEAQQPPAKRPSN